MTKLQQIIVVFLFALLQSYRCFGQYDPFDYFKLVLQWPPSICNGQRPCRMVPIPQDFTIHGFWPDRYQGRFPLSCYRVPYTQITDQNLLNLLNMHWPNIVRGYNPPFWEYEWNRHGVCALAWYTQAPYFYLAVLSKQDIDLLTHLRNSGITPNNAVPYYMDAFRNAVQQLTRTVPDFSCNYDFNGRAQLSEIRICYSPFGLKTDCGRINTNCPHIVFFPEVF